jgi:hypothetical protein
MNQKPEDIFFEVLAHLVDFLNESGWERSDGLLKSMGPTCPYFIKSKGLMYNNFNKEKFQELVSSVINAAVKNHNG